MRIISNKMWKTMMKMMKRWQLEQFGIENLTLVEVPVPTPQKNEVLIKVNAVSLNYRDKLVIEGELLPELPEMPFTPASDMSGEIVALGEGGSRFSIGEQVIANFWATWLDGKAPAEMLYHGHSLGGPLPGVLAEYIVLHEDILVRSPLSLTSEEAATLPVAGLTAWFALGELGKLQQNDYVLLQGTGGVSLFAHQIAHALGAHTIITSRSEEKLHKVKALGATAVINTQHMPNWADEVVKLTDGHGADHILELIGGDNLRQSVNALAADGRISQIGFMADSDLAVPALPLMLRRGIIQGITVGHRRALEDLCRIVEQYKITPIIGEKYDFNNAKQAFEHLQQGAFGKIVISVN